MVISQKSTKTKHEDLLHQATADQTKYYNVLKTTLKLINNKTNDYTKIKHFKWSGNLSETNLRCRENILLDNLFDVSKMLYQQFIVLYFN